MRAGILAGIDAHINKFDDGDWPKSWRQFFLHELMPSSDVRNLRKALADSICISTGINYTNDFSLIVHVGSGDVSAHQDCLSKSCFLIPIKTSPSINFFVDYKKIKVHKEKMLRFNDYDRHGIQNDYCAKFVFLTASLNN